MAQKKDKPKVYIPKLSELTGIPSSTLHNYSKQGIIIPVEEENKKINRNRYELPVSVERLNGYRALLEMGFSSEEGLAILNSLGLRNLKNKLKTLSFPELIDYLVGKNIKIYQREYFDAFIEG